MRPPEKIYLQINDDPDADFEDVDFAHRSEVTWCHERISASDIEYHLAPSERRKKRWKEAVLVSLLLCVSANAQNLSRPVVAPAMPKPDTTWNWQFKESSAEFIGAFTLDCLSSTGLFEHNRLLRNQHGGIRMSGCFVANGAAYGLTVLLQKKHPKIANWMRRVGAAAHFGAATHNFALKGGR